LYAAIGARHCCRFNVQKPTAWDARETPELRALIHFPRCSDLKRPRKDKFGVYGAEILAANHTKNEIPFVFFVYFVV